jgi:hypothetical protein
MQTKKTISLMDNLMYKYLFRQFCSSTIRNNNDNDIDSSIFNLTEEESKPVTKKDNFNS